MREFASYWKAGIQQINDDVLAYFATCRNGMDILKQVSNVLRVVAWCLSVRFYLNAQLPPLC